MGVWMGGWTGRRLNKQEEIDDNNKGVKPGIKVEAQDISVSSGFLADRDLVIEVQQQPKTESGFEAHSYLSPAHLLPGACKGFMMA